MSETRTFLPHLKWKAGRNEGDCVEHYYNNEGWQYVFRQEYGVADDGKILSRYLARRSLREIENTINVIPEPTRCFHEVMVSNCRRVYLDIDMELGPEDNYEWIEPMLPRVYDVIRSSSQMICWDKLADRSGDTFVQPDWMIFSSTNHTKVSLHIVAKNIATVTLEDALTAAKQAMGSFANTTWLKYSSESGTETPDDRFVDFCDRLWREADLGVYDKYRCLRVLHSHKLNSTRVKRSVVGDIKFEDSLVSYFDRSKVTIIRSGEHKEEKPVDPFARVLNSYEGGECDDATVNQVLDFEVDGCKLGQQYEFASREGHAIKFNRKVFGMCPCCKRIHENAGGVAYKSVDGALVFSCWRAKMYNAHPLVIVEGDTEQDFQSGKKTPWTDWRWHEPKLVANNTTEQDQPHVTIDWQHSTIVVKSGLGTGKTKALREHIASIPAATQVIIVTPRRSLGREFTRVFPDFEYYQNIKGGHGEIDSTHKRVIVQFESLHRITRPGNFILVLDEIVAIRGQAMFSNEHRAHSLSALDYLARKADQLIALDGGITSQDLNWIKHVRGEDGLALTVNRYKTSAGKTAVIYPDEETFTKNAIELFKQAKTEPVVVPCSSKTKADELYKYAVAAVGADKVILHTAATVNENEKYLANTAEHWSKCSILIYSPTITVGVSFELEHFHHLVCYFSYASVTAATAVQMMKRARSIANPRVHVFVDNTGHVRHLPKTRFAVKRAIERLGILAHFKQPIPEAAFDIVHSADGLIPRRYSPDGKIFTVPNSDPVIDPWIDAIIVQNQSRMRFKAIFATILRADGYAFEHVAPLDAITKMFVRDDIQETKMEVRCENADAIAQARIINEEEYHDLKDKPTKSHEDSLALERHHFKKFYGAEDRGVDKLSIKLWWKPHVVSFMKQIKVCSFTVRPDQVPAATDDNQFAPEVVDWNQVIENIESRINSLQRLVESTPGSKAAALISAHERMRVNERVLVGVSIMRKVFGDNFKLTTANTCTRGHFYERINEYTIEHGLDKISAVADLNLRLDLTDITAKVFLRDKVSEKSFADSTFKYYRTMLEKTLGIKLEIGQVKGKKVKGASLLATITTGRELFLALHQSYNGKQLVYHPLFVNVAAETQPQQAECFADQAMQLLEAAMDVL